MTGIYEGNLSVLKGRNPGLHARVSAAEEDPGIKVVEARDGNMVPEMVRGNSRLWLHSRYDPVREAERFIDEADTGAFNLFIVFGFAFGYHVEQLLQRAGPDAVVLVLEKDAAIIKKALQYRDLRRVLRDPRLDVLAAPEEESMAGVLRGKSTYRVSFLTHRGSFQLDPDYYTNLRLIAKSYLSTKEVNIATLAKFEKTWSSNTARNIREILALPGAASFFGRFTGFPAIVVLAGPSLTQSIDFIRKNGHRAVVIAVDTSYAVLLKHGIAPHFCVSVDPQVVNARYFEGDPGSQCILVADPTVHPSVFHFFRGRKILTGMAFQMMKWIEENTGARGDLAYGGSVSTNAYDFARKLGAAPVVLVGQDLAFTGGLAHARGSYLDEQVFLRSHRFSNPLMFNRYQKTVLPPVFVKGIRSPRVHTNHKLMIFLAWFQKQNDPSLINATWDGACITGVRHESMDRIDFPGRDDPGSLVERCYSESLPAKNELVRRREALLRSCSSMLQEVESLLPAMERSVKISGDLLEMIEGGARDQGKLDYILKRLSEADALIESKKTLKDMIGFTVQRVIHTITEGYEIEQNESELNEEVKIARRSLFLYRGLLEGSRFNLKILRVMKHILETDASAG